MSDTPETLDQRIAELVEALKLPLPETVRGSLDQQLAALRQQCAAEVDLQGVTFSAVVPGDVVAGGQVPDGLQHAQHIDGVANVGVAIAGNVAGNVTAFFTAAGLADPSAAQRELVASYLARLAQRCDRLRLSGTVRRERRGASPMLTLSQVYVALTAEVWELVREARSADDFAEVLEAGDPEVVPGRAAKRTNGPRIRRKRTMLLTEALSRHKQLVLLGGPGSGKSSFLRNLAVALARGEEGRPPSLPGWGIGWLLPLYASLGAFAAWAQQQKELLLDGPGLWRYLLATAQEYGLTGLDASLSRAFHQGGVLLLLDGLDEVAEPSLRIRVARAVTALAEAGGHVAVTCRVRSFEGPVAEPFAAWGAPVNLMPFSLGQMRHFVAVWYARSADHGLIDPDEASQRVSELSECLARLPSLRELGQTPLLLTIITILHFYEGKLPEDRADLYEDLVQLLLNRWTVQRREVASAPPPLLDQLKADGRLGGLKEYHLRNTLEALAYRAHQESPTSDGRGLLDRDRVWGAFQRLFEEFELDLGPVAEKTALVLGYLEHESGLLLRESGNLYGLPHLSYEEYLAGCHLSQQAAFHNLAYAHWQRDPGHWREVIFLALGRMVRGEGREAAANWLAFLLYPTHGQRVRDAVERQRATFFAYECLEQMGGKAALIGASTVDLPELWQILAAGLAAIVEGAVLPASDRVCAGVWLGELGDPRPGVCDLPPAMVPIAGGSFVIGLTVAEILDEWDFIADVRSEVSISIDAFDLARYPVTNAQFQLFLEADGYNSAAPWWGLDCGWFCQREVTEPRYWGNNCLGIARPNQPVVGVSWYEAMAFCAWLTLYLDDGCIYRLPSEAEWEYGARGAERRAYPWGDAEPDHERANFRGLYHGATTVGCFPNGATPRTGLLDIAGNVWEWTRSVYQPYPYDPNDGREDVSGPTCKRFTLRGGSWYDQAISLHAAFRYDYTPDYNHPLVGFRLARHRT